MNYLLCATIGYLLGSIPTAYIVLKKTHQIDIRETGSGNVGAMNSFEISKSKVIGILVFLIDALKGLLSVYLCVLIFPGDFVYPALALLFAVLSHCFNPWLEFKGGRGLATATGGTILLSPIIPATWCVLWVLVYLFKKDILLANISATIFTLLSTISSIEIIYKYSYPTPDSYGTILMFCVGLLTIIFIKHIDPLKEIIDKYKST
ncbi:MAG: glycerol-3-phosphate acyltransferase [Ignavibacteriaceae bacterium]